MKYGIIITGDDVLDELLAGLPDKLQKKLSRQATKKAAKDIVLPAAKAAAPFDTGELEESLVVRAMKRSRNKIGHMVTTKEGLWRGDQFYGAMLEFGTKERTQKSTGKSVGRIEPRKFAYLRPAVYDNEERIRQLYVNDLKELVNETRLKKSA